MSKQQALDELCRLHQARQAVTELLQSCQQAANAGGIVKLDHIGTLLDTLDEQTEIYLNVLQGNN